MAGIGAGFGSGGPAKGSNKGNPIINALGIPSRAVQNVIARPTREIVDALDKDPETRFSIIDLLTKSDTVKSLVNTQPTLARNLSPIEKMVFGLGADIVLDPINYLGVGLLTKPATAAKAVTETASAVNVARELGTGMKALGAGAQAAKVADDLNRLQGAATVANTLNDSDDVAKTFFRIGQRVNAKRIQTDILSSDVINVADRATEGGKLFRGGVASLLPETQQAIGYQSNLVFKIPFTEKAVLIPGTEKIGAAISVTGGRVFKGGFNSLVTSIDPKFWIGEEAMTLRMAANADLNEDIPNGMIRYYQTADGGWTTSKYKAVKDMVDVSAGLRVADVPESSLASSGWADRLANVAGLSDDEARQVIKDANLHRIDVPYELPKAFVAVNGRRLDRAIQAREAGQILQEVINIGNDTYGIKDIRLSMNQMSDLGASSWLDPNSKFREVIVAAVKNTRDSLVGKDGSLWRVPSDIVDRWVDDTLKVLDEHAAELKDLVSRPAEFSAARKKGGIGIMMKLGEQGKKAGKLRAAIAVDGSVAEAARLSQGIIKLGGTEETADAIRALYDDMQEHAARRNLNIETDAQIAKKAARSAKTAKPKSVEEYLADLLTGAKKNRNKNYAAESDVVARLLTGDIDAAGAKRALTDYGMDPGLLDSLLRPFSGGKDVKDLRKSIDQLIGISKGNAEYLADLIVSGKSAEDAVRFWEHILTNGWDELFDGAAPKEFVQSLLEGSGVSPDQWIKLAQGPKLKPTGPVKPAFEVVVPDENLVPQVVRVISDVSQIPEAVDYKTAWQMASSRDWLGARSASEYSAAKASEVLTQRLGARDRAQQVLDGLAAPLAQAESTAADAREYANLVDSYVRDAYTKYFASGAGNTEPLVVDWVVREIAPNLSKSVTGTKRGMAALRKSVQSDLAILDNLGAAESTLQSLRQQEAAVRKVLDNTPSMVTADELSIFEKQWQAKFDIERGKVDADLRSKYSKYLGDLKTKQAEANSFNAQSRADLVRRQKKMVEDILGNYRMSAMSKQQLIDDLSAQQDWLQTEMGRLLAMEQSLNNAAFALGDQVDKFTAYLYRDIQAQHVDLLRRAQKLGVTMNSAGDADVVFIETAKRLWEMNEEAASKLLNFSTVGDGGNVLMPKKMAEFITADQHAGEFSRITRLWRSTAILRPGFSNRNFIGAFFNNLSQGIRYPDYQTAAFVAQALKKNKSAAEALGKYAAEVGVTPNEVEEAFTILVANSQLVGDMAHGLHGSTKIGNSIDRGQAFFEKHSFAKNGYLRSRKPTSGGLKQAAYDVTVEDNVRLAQYLGLRRQGFSHMASMNQTMGTHFNYLDSSRLDAWIRKYVPFWTYQSRNLGLQAQLMLSHPETTKAFWTTREELRKDQAEGLPPWLAGFALPFGNTVADFSGMFPASDVVRVGDFVSRFPSTPDKSVYALTSQFMGGPQFSAAQLLMNKDLFRGGSQIYKPESAAGDVLSYLARSVGPSQQTLSVWDTLRGSRETASKITSIGYTLGLFPTVKEYTPR